MTIKRKEKFGSRMAPESVEFWVRISDFKRQADAVIKPHVPTGPSVRFRAHNIEDKLLFKSVDFLIFS